MQFYSDAYRKRAKGEFCVYCGCVAQELDHFPPKTYGNQGWLLPSCKECNKLAGTNFPKAFEYRARFVKDKLRLRYKRELALPAWDELELSEMSFRLRQNIKAWQWKRNQVQSRIAWNAMDYLRYIVPIKDFVLTYVEEDTLREKELELLNLG